MTSSKPLLRNVPSPMNGAKPNSYARFIPREELGGFENWSLDTLSGGLDPLPPMAKRQAAEAPKAAKSAPPAEDPAIALRALRQAAYQEGYRDGLAALESFKQSFAAQLTAQLGGLSETYAQQLEAIEQDLARAVAVTATQLARQIVRSEIEARPELVAMVANDALDTLLMSAKQITVRVHPDDHAQVAQGAAEVLAARGSRLLSDPTIPRGGCHVESDVGTIDASVEARWKKAVASMGVEEAFDADLAGQASDQRL